MCSSACTDCVLTKIFINRFGTNASMRQGVGQSLVVYGHVFVSKLPVETINGSMAIGVFYFCHSEEIHRTVSIQVRFQNDEHTYVLPLLTFFLIVHHKLLGYHTTRCLAIKSRLMFIHVGLFTNPP